MCQSKALEGNKQRRAEVGAIGGATSSSPAAAPRYQRPTAEERERDHEWAAEQDARIKAAAEEAVDAGASGGDDQSRKKRCSKDPASVALEDNERFLNNLDNSVNEQDAQMRASAVMTRYNAALKALTTLAKAGMAVPFAIQREYDTALAAVGAQDAAGGGARAEPPAGGSEAIGGSGAGGGAGV